jgi:hypothetical protein
MRARATLENNAEKIIKKSYPYILIHSGDSYWELKKSKISGNTLLGELSNVNERVDYYYNRALTSNNFQVKSGESYYLNQLHLYVDEFDFENNIASIDLDQINNLKVLDKNRGLSIIANLGIASTAAVGGMATFLAIACNCPHNYTFDGEKYHFNNTLFTGATAANLERNDYKYLPDYHPDHSTYKMIIKNEENEIQYTNLLELIAVSHSKNTEILSDQKGNIYSLSNRFEAIDIKNDADESIKNEVNFEDDLPFQFDKTGADDFSHIYAKFEVPQSTENAKIVIRAKNSEWAGLLYKSFSSLLGNKYSKWTKNNHKRSAEKANKAIQEAGIPLIVSAKIKGEWVTLESIDLVGEINYNSLVIPVPKEYFNSTTFEIRVSTGYKFWDLDALQMDFSSPESISIQRLNPSSAIGTADYKEVLALDDENYMVHSETGDSTIIEFKGIPNTSEKRTLILRSKGYYFSKTAYEGKTNWPAILAIKQSGGLSLFSKALYEAYSNQAIILNERK